jgi:hypothetical protein
MVMNMPLPQRIVQICLFIVAAIALIGGVLQMVLGQPETTPRLDNLHRFLAGIYFGCGLIALWTAISVRYQTTLIYLVALGVLCGGIGRLVSINAVGLPQPSHVWLGYLIPELVFPAIIIAAQMMTERSMKK